MPLAHSVGELSQLQLACCRTPVVTVQWIENLRRLSSLEVVINSPEV